MALEAIKFIHASQFNYASVMSPEIPQSKTYGGALTQGHFAIAIKPEKMLRFTVDVKGIFKFIFCL